jgi:hypothetical protein
MKKLILVILVMFPIIACEKSTDKIQISDKVSKTQYYDNEILSEQNQNIYGKWEYLYYSGGIGGGRFDPTYDFLEVVRFGIYGIISGNQIKVIGRLMVHKQDTNETIISFIPDVKYISDYYDLSQIIRFRGKDTLMLSDNYIDGYTEYFKRIK